MIRSMMIGARPKDDCHQQQQTDEDVIVEDHGCSWVSRTFKQGFYVAGTLRVPFASEGPWHTACACYDRSGSQ